MLQELSDGGGLLACALNAVNAALIDAGIPLKHTFGAAPFNRQLTSNPQLISQILQILSYVLLCCVE